MSASSVPFLPIYFPFSSYLFSLRNPCSAACLILLVFRTVQPIMQPTDDETKGATTIHLHHWNTLDHDFWPPINLSQSSMSSSPPSTQSRIQYNKQRFFSPSSKHNSLEENINSMVYAATPSFVVHCSLPFLLPPPQSP
jgi:hypothetical protein